MDKDDQQTSMAVVGMRKQPLGYTPGAPVIMPSAAAAETKQKGRDVRREKKRKRSVPFLPPELMGKVLTRLVETRGFGAVILLSMTCKSLRDQIGKDARLWHAMYAQWRGPVRHETRKYGPNKSRVMTVATVPTTPRCLPNFRMRTPSVR